MNSSNKDNILPKPYRFRKWTNKSYAVFNSIGREISIGVLSIDVSGRIGAKASCHSHGITLLSPVADAAEVPEEEPEETSILPVLEITPKASASDGRAGHEDRHPSHAFRQYLFFRTTLPASFIDLYCGEISCFTSHSPCLNNHQLNHPTL